MQPEFFFLAKFADRANRVHGTRSCRADGCYHRKRKIPFPPIGSDMLFEALNVDAASAKTGNADHVPFANSNLLRGPRNRDYAEAHSCWDWTRRDSRKRSHSSIPWPVFAETSKTCMPGRTL